MPSSVFKENIEFVGQVAERRRVRKPKPQLAIESIEDIDALVRKHKLLPEEGELLSLIELRRLGFSQIGEIIGCTRQNVHQKYRAVLKKIQPQVN